MSVIVVFLRPLASDLDSKRRKEKAPLTISVFTSAMELQADYSGRIIVCQKSSDRKESH